MSGRRDVAIVLSGGGVNGVLMELGFLKRVRESSLWPRVGWIFGTSSGALSGTMAALDRLDDLEEFLLALRPDDAFRPHRLWQLPLLGTHEYSLPGTVAERIAEPVEVARALAASDIELVVCATDVTDGPDLDGANHYELVYSSKRTPPEEMGQAILASAAISALVLPLRVGDRIATDGGWTRNFPLGHAYDHPDVAMIVAFRFIPRYPRMGPGGVIRLRRRLQRFSRVPPIRALLVELREAEERAERGEPVHLMDMLVRLMRVSVMRNTVLEERIATDRDQSIRELAALRDDVVGIVREHVRGSGRRERATRAVEERFSSARFPFRHSRLIPRITVRGAVEEVSLDPTFRTDKTWTEEAKRTLIRRGYELAERELRRHGVDDVAAAL